MNKQPLFWVWIGIITAVSAQITYPEVPCALFMIASANAFAMASYYAIEKYVPLSLFARVPS